MSLGGCFTIANGMERSGMEWNGVSRVLSLLTTKSLYIIPRNYSA
jgi:hypothetical protein